MLTVKSKHADRLSFLKDAEEDAAVFSSNKYQVYVGIIKKAAGGEGKGYDVLEVVERTRGGECVWGKNGAMLFSCCCWLKVIEFLIDFSQFYFKFIKPGRIA